MSATPAGVHSAQGPGMDRRGLGVHRVSVRLPHGTSRRSARPINVLFGARSRWSCEAVAPLRREDHGVRGQPGDDPPPAARIGPGLASAPPRRPPLWSRVGGSH